MTGIRFLTDEDGRKVAVRINLKTHGELWEDFYHALIAEERRDGSVLGRELRDELVEEEGLGGDGAGGVVAEGEEAGGLRADDGQAALGVGEEGVALRRATRGRGSACPSRSRGGRSSRSSRARMTL